MWIVLAVLALIVVAIVVAVVFRRPSGDDLNSVRSYHHALGTLEHLAERSDQPAATVERSEGSGARTYRRTDATPAPGPDESLDRGRVANGNGRTPVPQASAVGPGSTRSVPPVPVRGRGEFPDPETPLIFDDARHHEGAATARGLDGALITRTDRAQRHALESMNHRRRRGTAMMIAVAVVAVFVVLAVVGSHRSNHGDAKATTGTSTTVGHHGTTGGTTQTTVKPKHVAAPPPTTAPTQIVATSATTHAAIYPVPTASYTLTVTATAPCWVDATAVATGATVWAGTLAAGGSQDIPATGAVKVELGSPSVTMAVGGIPVVFPTPLHSPFVATFEPTTSTSTTTTTSTTP